MDNSALFHLPGSGLGSVNALSLCGGGYTLSRGTQVVIQVVEPLAPFELVCRIVELSSFLAQRALVNDQHSRIGLPVPSTLWGASSIV